MFGSLKRSKSRLESGAWYNQLTIQFEDGKEESFYIELTKTGTFVVPGKDTNSDWTKLDHHKCSCCPLNSAKVPYCPAAESLESTLLRLKGHYSYEKVIAKVTDSAQRMTIVNWQLQEVGATFVQLAVFSSSCPIGRLFKPLLRDMRPFATNEELMKHLISKFLLKHRGEFEQCKLDIMAKMEPLRIVFSCLAKRLSANTSGDAIANSIVRLDAFIINVSLYLEEIFKELTKDMGWDFDKDGENPHDATTKLASDETTRGSRTVKMINKLKKLING
jgi:hypothetical protein